MSEKISEEVIEGIKEAMEEAFYEKQMKPFQYVVGYYRTKDSHRIGYHLSTFCQLTDDILKAKRYHGEDPTEQLKIIRKNIDHMLTVSELPDDAPGLAKAFRKMTLDVRDAHFSGMKPEDIYIDAYYIGDDLESQKFEAPVIIQPTDGSDK